MSLMHTIILVLVVTLTTFLLLPMLVFIIVRMVKRAWYLPIHYTPQNQTTKSNGNEQTKAKEDDR
jgi:hypothetical protein